MTKQTRFRILVADDDHAIRELLTQILCDDYDVEEAVDGGQALEGIKSGKYDLVLLDFQLPGMNGIDVLKQLRDRQGELPVILITGHGSPNIAIQASSLGVYGFVSKPFEVEALLQQVHHFFEAQRLKDEVRALRSQVEPGAAVPAAGSLQGRAPQEKIIGASPLMYDVYRLIGRSAGTEATVLINGETGTGKELVANAVHAYSTYRAGPLIKVNCAALPETLLETELFGHEKGAFTNAVTQRKGRFELAHKGTIFLDEIGEMSLGTQRKLLRVLQEREFERVGGSIPIKVDVRVVVATNRDLRAEVEAGRFREDLYYRLNVIPIELPPLRRRKEDIPLLVEHFLDKHRYSSTSQPARISEEAMQRLLDYDWPGNVRELENSVQRAVVLSKGGIITSSHLAASNLSDRSMIDVAQLVREGVQLDTILRRVEQMAISQALEANDSDQALAYAALGIKKPMFGADQ
ncbi:MAG TPA: sigma-54 dependent transcriptional regulator [Chloroflexia bacterium]|nr:sigma-54 dependent transcriptional regulator [Chloroflexia bacterium]